MANVGGVTERTSSSHAHARPHQKPTSPDMSLEEEMKGVRHLCELGITAPVRAWHHGLEVSDGEDWLLVDPLPDALIVNVGDHLEIFTNGRYKSVLHRVRVNSTRLRISVASLHSLPPERVIGPAPELLADGTPRRYLATDLATFLDYLSSAEGKNKTFLQSRRITLSSSYSSLPPPL